MTGTFYDQEEFEPDWQDAKAEQEWMCRRGIHARKSVKVGFVYGVAVYQCPVCNATLYEVPNV